MANNCLLTKLKENVDNPNLLKLGVFYVKGVVQDETPGSYSVGFITKQGPATIRAPYGFIRVDNPGVVETEYTGSGALVTLTNVTDNNVEIDSVYNLIGIRINGNNFKRSLKLFDENLESALKYGVTKCLDLYSPDNYIRASILKNLVYLNMNSCRLNPDISIEEFISQNLGAYYLSFITGTGGLSGTLTTNMLTPMINLKELHNQTLSGDIINLPVENLHNIFVGSNQVVGSIEDYVAKQRTFGRTEGAVKFRVLNNSAITYQGSPVSQYCSQHSLSGSEIYVSWTSSTINIGSSVPSSYEPSLNFSDYCNIAKNL